MRAGWSVACGMPGLVGGTASPHLVTPQRPTGVRANPAAGAAGSMSHLQHDDLSHRVDGAEVVSTIRLTNCRSVAAMKAQER